MTGVFGARPLTAQTTTPTQEAPAPPGGGRAPHVTTAAPGGVPKPGSKAADAAPVNSGFPRFRPASFHRRLVPGRRFRRSKSRWTDGSTGTRVGAEAGDATPGPASAGITDGRSGATGGNPARAPRAQPHCAARTARRHRRGRRAEGAGRHRSRPGQRERGRGTSEGGRNRTRAGQRQRGQGRHPRGPRAQPHCAARPPPHCRGRRAAGTGRHRSRPGQRERGRGSPKAVETATRAGQRQRGQGRHPRGPRIESRHAALRRALADLPKGRTAPNPPGGRDRVRGSRRARRNPHSCRPAWPKGGRPRRSRGRSNRPPARRCRVGRSPWGSRPRTTGRGGRCPEGERRNAVSARLGDGAGGRGRRPLAPRDGRALSEGPRDPFPRRRVASGLPFSLDLLAALRSRRRRAPPAPSALHRPADAPDVPTQIVRAAHLQWRDGVGEARLRLNPEHLGEVTISLRVEQGAVFATIRAESPAALHSIQARQQELAGGSRGPGAAPGPLRGERRPRRAPGTVASTARRDTPGPPIARERHRDAEVRSPRLTTAPRRPARPEAGRRCRPDVTLVRSAVPRLRNRPRPSSFCRR